MRLWLGDDRIGEGAERMTGPGGYSQGSSRNISSLMWSFLVGWAQGEDEGTGRDKQECLRYSSQSRRGCL